MLNKISFFTAFAILSFASMAFAAPQPQNLANGVLLIKDPVQIAPYVSMTILIKAGAADETAETAGWRQLLASTMMRATKHDKDILEGPQLPQAAETAGGQISTLVLDDAIAFTASGDSSTQQELAHLLLDVVLHPRLSEADFAAARREMLGNLGNANNNDIPDHSRATETLQSLLYRDANSKKPIVYGLPPEGTVDSLTAMTDEKLLILYQSYFVPSTMVISLSGDVNEIGLNQIFTKIPSSTKIFTLPVVAFDKLTPSTSQTIRLNTPSSWGLVGFRIDRQITNTGRDLAALRVLTAALAETAPSLLSTKLLSPQGKNQETLANQVSGELLIRREGSELMIAVQSDTSHLTSSITAVKQAINELKTMPLTDDQLQAAIMYAQGDWASTRDSISIRSVLAGYAKVQGLFSDSQWPEQLKAVTAADVQNVAKKYLDQSAEVIVNSP